MKTGKYKLIEGVALIAATVGFTIGFAAFSGTVDINEKEDYQYNEEDFIINFSASKDNFKQNEVIGVNGTGQSVGSIGLVDNYQGSIANLQAVFTEPGQTVTYTLYANNIGKYDAYLDSITYSNVNGSSFFKSCEALNENTTNLNLISSACEDVNLNVEVNGSGNGKVFTNGSLIEIDNHILPVGGKEKIIITISYDKNGTYVDGDFVVRFGDVKINYLSKLKHEYR